MFNGTLYGKVVVRSTHCRMLPSVSHIELNRVYNRMSSSFEHDYCVSNIIYINLTSEIAFTGQSLQVSTYNIMYDARNVN